MVRRAGLLIGSLREDHYLGRSGPKHPSLNTAGSGAWCVAGDSLLGVCSSLLCRHGVVWSEPCERQFCGTECMLHVRCYVA
jgi:hypothetical protein